MISISTEGFITDALTIGADLTAPTITIVSPTPNTPPGALGGFPADKATAAVTPIVLQVNDLSPGVKYVAVFVRLPTNTVEVVYRKGNFSPGYAAGSTQIPSALGVQLSVKRDAGWPIVDGIATSMVFTLDALDAAGNLL